MLIRTRTQLEFEEGRRELGLCLLLKACCLFGCPIQALKDLEMEFEPLTSSLQVYTLSDNDLEALADVNRIALNLMDMEVLANGSEVC